VTTPSACNISTTFARASSADNVGKGVQVRVGTSVGVWVGVTVSEGSTVGVNVLGNWGVDVAALTVTTGAWDAQPTIKQHCQNQQDGVCCFHVSSPVLVM
jgi:hypothetical protein